MYALALSPVDMLCLRRSLRSYINVVFQSGRGMYRMSLEASDLLRHLNSGLTEDNIISTASKSASAG